MGVKGEDVRVLEMVEVWEWVVGVKGEVLSALEIVVVDEWVIEGGVI